MDVLDGGPVPFLYPFVKEGIGLVFPATLELGINLFEFRVNNIFPQLIYEVPESLRVTKSFLDLELHLAILLLSVIAINEFKRNYDENRTYL